MKLIAKNFRYHPEESSAAKHLGPLIVRINQISFSMWSGSQNSNQLDSDFDKRLEGRIHKLGTKGRSFSVKGELKIKPDFSFGFKGKCVVVEIEKTNQEKILYDILKAHIYLKNGADYSVLLLPNNYVHSGGIWKLFDVGKKRFNWCREYEFGTIKTLEKILLVGYEQFTTDGVRLEKGMRKELVKRAKK